MPKEYSPAINADYPAADLILNNPYSTLLFEHLEIKTVLQDKTITDVCTENGISTALFLSLARLFMQSHQMPKAHYTRHDVKNMIGYLKHCHSYYLDEKYPQIQLYIQELRDLNNTAEINLLEKFFNEYFQEVKEHLDYENKTVFPYISGLLEQLDEQPFVLHSDYSVSEYKAHHDNIEEKLSDIKNLIAKYLPVKNHPEIKRKLLFGLSELEFDLHIHSEIEDLVLIPLVEQIEIEIRQRNEK